MTEPTTRLLERPDGAISYDDNGIDGPLVIAAPGMGDTRHVYRHLRQPMSDAGIRLVSMDLRGMGGSTTGWPRLDAEAIASDYLALIEALGAERAVLVGNSLSAGSAVIASTDAPERVVGLMLIGPFVREVPMKWWQKAAFAAVLTPPWGRAAWVWYYKTALHPGTPPPDHSEHVERLAANLKEPGRFADFRTMSTASHAESGRRLDHVTQPTTVIMGTADPDFPDPVVEATEIGEILGAEVILSDGSGHYPQAQTPDVVAEALVKLVGRAAL